MKPFWGIRTGWLLVLLWGVFSFPDVAAANDQGQNSMATSSRENYAAPDSFDAFFTLYQPYMQNISAYNPMYFVVGGNPEKSAFQFSFKYRFFNDNDPLATDNDWITHLFLAYTQTSFWDLRSQSKPFEDTSYKPELFYLSSNLGRDKGPFSGLFIQSGAQHESNGQSGPLSRSTNFFYFKPIMIFYHKSSGNGLQIAPKVWTYYFNEDQTNPDLNDYRGYFDFQLKFGNASSIVVDTHFWAAKKGCSFQWDLTYPLTRHIKTNLNFYLHAQYSNRLAERLRSYQDRSEAFRIGFSIVR